MTQRQDRRQRLRQRPTGLSKIVASAATLLLMATGLVSVPTIATADEHTTIAAGVVLADANKNNAVDTGGNPGINDLGVAGVKVNLECASPLVPANRGWTTTTDALGKWTFAGNLNIGEKCVPGSELFVSINLAGVAGDVYAVHKTTSAQNAFSAVGQNNQLAKSASFAGDATGQELNALVWPTWKLNISLL